MKRILPVAMFSLMLLFTASCGRESTGDAKIDALIEGLPAGWNGKLRHDSLIIEWNESAFIAWEDMRVPDSMRVAGLTFTPEYIRENGEEVHPTFVLRTREKGSASSNENETDNPVEMDNEPWFESEKYELYHGQWNWEKPLGREFRPHFEPDSLWLVFRSLNFYIADHLDPVQ